METEIHAFSEKFGLNQDARNKLLQLNPELQTIAIEQFDPPVSADNKSLRHLSLVTQTTSAN